MDWKAPVSSPCACEYFHLDSQQNAHRVIEGGSHPTSKRIFSSAFMREKPPGPRTFSALLPWKVLWFILSLFCSTF